MDKYLLNSVVSFAAVGAFGYCAVERLMENDYKSAAVLGALDLGALVLGIAGLKLYKTKDEKEL